eukprot:gene14976-14775_t
MQTTEINQPTVQIMGVTSKATRVASMLAVSALALGLMACSKTEEPTAGQRLDSAVEKTEQAAAEARAKTEAAVQKAEVQMEKGAERAEVAAKDLGDSTKQAANTAMEKMDDASITAQVSAGLAKDPDLSAIKINVDTLGG